MRPLINKLKPASGFSKVLHIGFNVLLPLAAFILVRIDFAQLALLVVLLSKWRIIAVRPRFWLANLRANAVDIMVGVSMVIFMVAASDQMFQLFWVVVYGLWLTLLKPASGMAMVALQAGFSFICGLMALSIGWDAAPLYGLVLLTGGICYVSAHHFFDAFDEPHTRLLSYIWGYFGAALTWVLGHWLLFYGLIPQNTLLLLPLGYGLATLYYLDHRDRLSKNVRRQILFIMVAVVSIIIIFSDWGNKIV
ncbi:MAG TPA: hypothetical protein VFI74_00650 [Candidatus Saccharimonadales bacterium]|nr:hypothetical protein [Candidatus Saccharimonadales bacterium]